MDVQQFDNLTRRLAAGASRRAIITGLLGGLAAGLTGLREVDAQTRQPNGTACSRATQCQSLKCVDGVCCNSACAGQCEACNLPSALGTCTPVAGQPVGNRPTCPGTGPCKAACDGVNRALCAAYPGGTTPCGASTCSDGWQTTYACGGNGTCHPTTTACGLYMCTADGTSCHTSCASDAGCVGEAHCANGVCQGDLPLGQPCTGADQCQSGYCVDGVCCVEACEGSCRTCNVPGQLGFCTEEADGAVCAGGTCCDGDCVDTASDPEHCGACDAACPIPPCRTATCTAGVCGSEPNPALDNQSCNDGDACTTGDHCENGECVGTLLDCDDGDPCTIDSCDPALGCVHTPSGCPEEICPIGHKSACFHAWYDCGPPNEDCSCWLAVDGLVRCGNPLACQDAEPCQANDECVALYGPGAFCRPEETYGCCGVNVCVPACGALP